MKTYHGGCHCGAVRFEFQAESIAHAIRCNCTICTKKGAVHFRMPAEHFVLLQGEHDLDTYRFGTLTARHRFCKHCGIHPFSHPRIAPDQVSVNLRCVDTADLPELPRLTTFDGRNWESAVEELRRPLPSP